MKPSRTSAEDPQSGRYSDGSLIDVVTDAVSHPRRRRLLAHLLEQQRPVLVDDLATVVAQREYADPGDEEREEVLTALYHHHLPKLAVAGIVEYEGEGDWTTVSLATDATPVRASLRAALGEEIPEYYTT